MKNFINCAVLVIAGCTAILSCDSNASSASYTETAMSLEEKERSSPTLFLYDEQGTYRKNIFGEWVIEGVVVNSAKIAAYKDAVLSVSFYSKTDTFLGTKEHTVYEIFAPQSTRSYKIKVYGPDAIGIEITDARSTNI